MIRRGVKPVSNRFRPADWLDCGGDTIRSTHTNTQIRCLRKDQSHFRMALSVEQDQIGLKGVHITALVDFQMFGSSRR